MTQFLLEQKYVDSHLVVSIFANISALLARYQNIAGCQPPKWSRIPFIWKALHLLRSVLAGHI
jgi:hypothetical protein